MADYAATGQYAIAAKELDDPGVQALYGDNSKLLWLLDRGSIAFAQGDDKRAFAVWEEADKIMDLWREQPPGDTVASWLLNDEVTNYIASPYEDMYVSAMKLLVNLRLGRIEGGATVEARRAAGKANLLRDRYLKYDSALRKKDAGAYNQAMASRPSNNLFAEATSGGQFIESPLATYLSAVVFAKSGESENQSVAARRLAEILSAQGGLVGNVNASDFASMGDLRQDTANVLLVAFAGRAPIKVPQRIGPIPIYTYPLYIELPKLKSWVSEVRSVRVIAERIATAPGATPSASFAASGENRIESVMPMIEDLSQVATVNHERELPQIYTRSIIRSSLKAAASAVATEAVRRSTRNSNVGDLATIGAVIAGLLFVTATERADLRCWAFLPGKAHVQLLNLPPGTWRISMEYRGGSGGTVFKTPPETVTMTGEPTQLATVIGHFWR